MIQTPSTNSRKERGKNSRAFGRAKSEGEGVERLKEKETERERETIVLSRFVFVERKGRALLRCARAGSLIQKQSSLRQPGTLFAFPITQTQPIQPVCRTGSSPPHLGRNTPPPGRHFLAAQYGYDRTPCPTFSRNNHHWLPCAQTHSPLFSRQDAVDELCQRVWVRHAQLVQDAVEGVQALRVGQDAGVIDQRPVHLVHPVRRRQPAAQHSTAHRRSGDAAQVRLLLLTVLPPPSHHSLAAQPETVEVNHAVATRPDYLHRPADCLLLGDGLIKDQGDWRRHTRACVCSRQRHSSRA